MAAGSRALSRGRPVSLRRSAPPSIARNRGGRHPGRPAASLRRDAGGRRSRRGPRGRASWPPCLRCGFCHRLACRSGFPDASPFAALFRCPRTFDARRRAHRYFLCRRLVGRRPPQDQQLADVLHGRRGKLSADLPEHRVALTPDVAERAYLDQLVRAQVDVDFLKDGRRQAMLADRNDGVQMMRPGAQLAPLDGSQGEHPGSVTDGASVDDRFVRTADRPGIENARSRAKSPRCPCASAPRAG